ncbi:MAG: T9SS C-terminal target domain-containing protein [Calditrichaeota bacterium]|nr:MAG: T9SS C-terminal target domain-containing protein [Calditrichota bacterium]
MRVLVLSLIIFTTSFAFARTQLPRNYLELEKELSTSQNTIVKYQQGQDYFILLGLKEPKRNEPTLFRTRLTDSPQLEWEVLDLDIPVLELTADSEGIFILTDEGLFFSSDEGRSFFKSVTFEPKDNFSDFVKVLKDSPEFLNPYSSSQKYLNQINDLPPYVPLVNDTILWDTAQVLLQTILPSGSLFFMHGRVTTGDSGLIHIIAVQEDEHLKYLRSDDYGESFTSPVILADTVAGIRKVIATEDNVYGYAINSTSSSDPKQILVVSNDKGLSWNPSITFPFGTQSNFTARNDTVYDYQEGGASGTIWQAKSFDTGNTFGSYAPITDSIYASIQRPQMSIGGNTIAYIRTGNDTLFSGSYLYRSFDLGDNWLPPLGILNPQGINSSSRSNLYFHDDKFHFIKGQGFLVYTRSNNYGNTFIPMLSLCTSLNPNSICAGGGEINIVSNKNNVCATFIDDTYFVIDHLQIRFSRDNGDSWSQPITASQQIQGFDYLDTIFSSAIDDSLFYVVYEASKELVSSNSWDSRLFFRRGFYKFPLCSLFVDTLDFTSLPLPNILETEFVLSNTGNTLLEIKNIEFPEGVTLTNQPDSTFLVEPDSLKSVGITVDFTKVGISEIVLHTNEQLDSVKTILVKIDTTTTGISENENLLENFKLEHNYPNPFNPTTIINYQLSVNSEGKLIIFNVLGQKVREFELTEQIGSVVWNGTDSLGKQVSSGVYLYRLESGEFQKAKKMILLR